MKTSLAALIVIGFVSATVALLVPARRVQTEPQFKDRPLSYWSRFQTERPADHRKALLALGPAIVPYLVKEIKRYEPYRRNVTDSESQRC